MPIDIAKAQLEGDAAAEAAAAVASGQDELLEKNFPNVVGVGAGIKWSDGEPTGEPAVVTLVTHKVSEEELSSGQTVPEEIGGVQSDVLAVGDLVALDQLPRAGAQSLAERVRPAQGGYSCGHPNVTAGTIGTCVYDMQEGSGRMPPVHGIGKPSKTYILSNNHILAAVNQASLGDPIVQPGPVDGGSVPADVIARLSNFVPLDLTPAVPLNQHDNLVDAAIAEGHFHELNREIYWIGHVKGWRPRNKVTVGMAVQKTGRTTNFTLGRVTVVNATLNINIGGNLARFRDQIVTTDMSAGGDSGSLITDLDENAVGLLFAGSNVATIANQIENVRRLLRVEVAEKVV